MARGRQKIGMDAIDQQIEAARKDIIKTKQKYDAATDRLKKLLDEKKEIQAEELMTAVMNSRHSYEDILQYINSEIDDE